LGKIVAENIHVNIIHCERNSCVCVTIATRYAVTGEEQLESLNAKLGR